MQTAILITGEDIHRGGFTSLHENGLGMASLPYVHPDASPVDGKQEEYQQKLMDGTCSFCLSGLSYLFSQGYDDHLRTIRAIREEIAEVKDCLVEATSVPRFNDDKQNTKQLVAAVWNRSMKRLGWDVPPEYLDPDCL